MVTLAQRLVSLTAAAAILAVSASCGGASSSTAPSPTQTTDTLTGTVAVGGSASSPFTVNYAFAATDVTVTLKNLTSVATGAAVAYTIGLGIGTVAFDGSCTRSPSFTDTASKIGSQYNTALTSPGSFGPGVPYCISMYDPGTGVLTEPVTYTVTVLHY